MKTRCLLMTASVFATATIFAPSAAARPEPRHATATGRTPPISRIPMQRSALPLPPNVTPALAKKLKSRARSRTRELAALNYWLWRGHTCEARNDLTGDTGWHTWTPYGLDPTGSTSIYSRAWFFTSPSLMTPVWSQVGVGPWWIQAAGNSNAYYRWSGSMWQGPFPPNQAFTQSTYGGTTGTNYQAVLTEVWIWTGQWYGPYSHLEHASGYYALIDPDWACAPYLI